MYFIIYIMYIVPCIYLVMLSSPKWNSNLLFVPCVDKKNLPISMVYIPSHLYHMLFELFKVQHSSKQRIYGDVHSSCLTGR